MEEKKSLQVSKHGLMQITTIEEAFRQASLYHKSGLVPKSFDSPEKVLVGLQFAAELKLPQLTALKSMYVVNGIPALFGDLPLSLVMQSGYLEYIKEKQYAAGSVEISSKNGNLESECVMAVCIVKRKGYPEEVERSYSWAEAQAAGLDKNKWGDKDTWKNHRRRMLQMRSRSWALKDVFPDVLMGVAIREYDEFEQVEPRDVSTKTFSVSQPEQVTVVVEEAFDIPQSTQATIPENPEIVKNEEPPELDQSEKIDEGPFPQSGGGMAWPDKPGQTPDENGFVTDPEKPFIKTKAKEPEKSKSLNEIMKDRAGEQIVNCWKKHQGEKIKNIPEDELTEMLLSLDVKSKAGTKFPEEWELFYNTACTYLNRKKDM